ncbi:MAG TPA: PDZ domain-containing protein [Longimicrobium sp.]|nr:PDZ domain-containing protein [Longimicrobium sp.]
MTATRPAGYRARGSLLAVAAVCVAAAACGVASGSARPAGDDAADAPGALSEADTGVVITERRDGRLQATVHLGQGRTMVMFGPDPRSGSMGFTYRFREPTGMPDQPMPRRYAVITAVAPGSAAEQGGMRAGDQMLAVNGRDGRNPWLFRDRTPGTVYDVRVGRSGAAHGVRVVVGPAPSRAQVEWDLRRQGACARQASAIAAAAEDGRYLASPITVGGGDRSLSGGVCAVPY